MITVPADSDGQRVDNFLVKTVKGVPRSLIYRIVRSGEVRVNGKRVKPDSRLATGDQMRLPPLRTSAPVDRSQAPAALVERLVDARLEESADYLVLNKPAGVAVHSGSGVAWGVIEALRAGPYADRYIELVHRLDRETSGCLVLAKSADALRRAQAAIADVRSDKRYLVLVRGAWQLGDHTVDLALQRGVGRDADRRVVARDDGKKARTRFSPVTVRRLASLVEARLGSGRTHQIRVHSQAVGHPVAGDDRYGDRDFNALARQRLGLDRLFLHAHHLTMDLGGRILAVQAPLPEELRAVVDRLEAPR